MTCTRTTLSCFVAFCLMLTVGCSKSKGGSSEYENSLTFGTALGGNGFDLTNEGTSFSLSSTGGTLYFKLESAEDMGGRAVRLYVNGGTYATNDFTNPQSYGHILLSSFRITDTGTFPVKGYLVAQVGPDIGKETFIAESTVSMLP